MVLYFNFSCQLLLCNHFLNDYPTSELQKLQKPGVHDVDSFQFEDPHFLFVHSLIYRCMALGPLLIESMSTFLPTIENK